MKKREYLLIGFIIAVDLITKSWSEAMIGFGNSREVIEGFFSISIVRNTGAAWSLLEGKMNFFYIMTFLALAVMIIAMIRTDKTNRLPRIALCFMIGGTLGNFFDRAVYHYVRDFLDFIIFGYDFPVFNAADMALCFGVFLLVIDAFFMPDGGKKNG